MNRLTDLTKEGIKAIRFCRGYTSDLRVKLPLSTSDYLFDFVVQNAVGIYGLQFTDVYPTIPDVASPNWNTFASDIDHAVKQIITGTAFK